MNSVATVQKRIVLVMLAVLAMLAAVVVRVAWLQAARSDELAARLRGQVMDNKAINMPRGPIYDRNGREMAMSITVKSLYADPMLIRKEGKVDPAAVARAISPLLGLSEDEIVRKLTSDSGFVWLKRLLDKPASDEIGRLIRENGWNGVAFVEESKRIYPNDELAAQVIGFVGTDDNGLAGIELEFDSKLRGGRYDQWVETDMSGTPIFDSIIQYTSKRQGKALYLTVDQVVQAIVEQALDRGVQATKADGAVAIVLDPRTGEVLAMASRPTFNPNRYEQASPVSWRNRAISMVYEPGSTFKPVVAAAAMQLGLVHPDDPLYDGGSVSVGERVIKNWDGGGLGAVTFTDIVKYSVNTGFVQVGLRMTADQELDFVEKFGFGQPTRISLPGEESGILFSRADITRSDQASMSIGQGVAVTPIQLIRAIAAIANGGLLLEPHIVREIRDAEGGVEFDASTTPVRQVIQPEVAAELAKMMQQVISDGSGKRAAVKGYNLAGKTGTAERLREGGGGYSGYIASFVGFGPVEEPQFVVLVVIDNPKGLIYGGEIAAPVFREIVSQLLSYRNVPRTVDSVVEQAARTAAPPSGSDGKSSPPPPAGNGATGRPVMPDLRGLNVRQVCTMLSDRGIGVRINGSGLAVGQSVPPGRPLDENEVVTVDFAWPVSPLAGPGRQER
ncbi:MAG: penicillin-binding transpeptidase domain-containing protein [Negativicutes bacterium]|nr:penicillin-binding transpeptidase domain-containing protein [Negativicutes bacterium]